MNERVPHVYLESIETHCRFKVAAAELGVPMARLAEEVIEHWLRAYEKRKSGETGKKVRKPSRKKRDQ